VKSCSSVVSALEELRLGADSQFDADVVAALEIELSMGDGTDRRQDSASDE
jgi:hypothetical protein